MDLTLSKPGITARWKAPPCGGVAQDNILKYIRNRTGKYRGVSGAANVDYLGVDKMRVDKTVQKI